MEALSNSTKDVLSGSNVVVEFLINREHCEERIRLKLYAALTRPMLYMEKKDIVICGNLFIVCVIYPTLSWDVWIFQHCSDIYMTHEFMFPHSPVASFVRNLDFTNYLYSFYLLLFPHLRTMGPTGHLYGAFYAVGNRGNPSETL